MEKKITTGLLALLSGMSVSAQSSNTGVVMIAPNTVVGVVADLKNKESGTFLNDGELHLYSGLKNEGLITFTPNQGSTTLFRGTQNQIIEGDGKSEFEDITFNTKGKKSGIELHSEISITKQANFTHGIINSKDFGGLVVFEKGSKQINASNKSFVEGKIKKNGGEAFTFPEGRDGNFRHSAIAATNDLLNSFESNYFLENSDALYPHSDKVGAIDFIDDQEYWVLERQGGKANAMLTLSWDENSTTPRSIADSPEDIHIVRWDQTKKYWVDEGGVVDVRNRTVTTPVSVSGYGIFTLARGVVSGHEGCNKLVIYNAVSGNGDGLNDYFRIDGLKACGEGGNTLEIFTAYGVKVYKTHNYGENGNVFNGYPNVQTAVSSNQYLPVGTYLYSLRIEGEDHLSIHKTGYLYLK